MNVETVKWIAATVLFVLTLFFSSLPLCLLSKARGRDSDGRKKYTRILSLLSCCGGGVFLGTCLLHLFPDVQKQMDKVFDALQTKQVFPVSEFLLAFGFLLILIIEQVVLTFKQEDDDESGESSFLSHQHSHNGTSISTNVNVPNYGAVSEENSQILEKEMSFHKDQSSHSSLRSIVLVLALSLHSIFEGLAIGLQSSSENVVSILVAVMIHKSIIAFTLGLNLTHSKFTRNLMLRCILVFSLMSPIGTVIGCFVSGAGSGLPVTIASGILQGIAAGTFVYVTFFEVLPHELNAKEDKLAKMFCLLLGFSAMSLLVLYVPS